MGFLRGKLLCQQHERTQEPLSRTASGVLWITHDGTLGQATANSVSGRFCGE